MKVLNLDFILNESGKSLEGYDFHVILGDTQDFAYLTDIFTIFEKSSIMWKKVQLDWFHVHASL